MADRTLEKIYELSYEGRDAALWLINGLREAGLPAVVVEARRGIERQRELFAAGRSKTLRSKHLVGRALDLAFLGIATDDVPVEWWDFAGRSWELIGGTWGGRFRTLVDRVHFEW